jgi:hypothetical protein
VVIFTSRILYRQGKSPWYQLDRRLGGTQSRSGCGDKGKKHCPCRESNPSRSAHCLVIKLSTHAHTHTHTHTHTSPRPYSLSFQEHNPSEYGGMPPYALTEEGLLNNLACKGLMNPGVKIDYYDGMKFKIKLTMCSWWVRPPETCWSHSTNHGNNQWTISHRRCTIHRHPSAVCQNHGHAIHYQVLNHWWKSDYNVTVICTQVAA